MDCNEGMTKEKKPLIFNCKEGEMKPTSYTMSKLQAKGGSISFLEVDKSQLRLAYINGSHEYVVFDPNSDESHERSAVDYDSLSGHEETGKRKF